MRNQLAIIITIMLLPLFLISSSAIGYSDSYSPDSAPITTESEITEVTVYLNGAMITRSLSIEKTGTQTLLLKGLPTSIREGSLVIDAEKSIAIISINSYVRAKLDGDDSAIKSLATSSAAISDSITKIDNLITVYETEEKIITNFDCSAGGNKLSIEDVIKASEFYRVRLKEIKSAVYELQQKKQIFKTEKSLKENKFRELSRLSEELETQIEIKLKAPRPVTDGLQVHYYLPEASWTPFYDIKIEDKNAELDLYHKAFIYQNTGNDWSDVNLTLSNANPIENKTLPIMTKHNILGPRTYKPKVNNYKKKGNAGYEGIVVTEDGEPIIGANILVPDNNFTGTITDMDGRFYFPDNITQRMITVSYVGYKKLTYYLNNSMNHIVMGESSELLDEIVIRGSRAGASSYYIDGVRVNTENAQKMIPERRPIRIQKSNAINSVEYKLEQSFSISSGTDKTDVLLQVQSVPCLMEHIAIPGKSQNAFLTALLPQWNELDLLAAKVNIFLSNSYKGYTYIDPKSIKDTLDISLGIDPEVIIERERLKDYYSKKILSNKVEENIVYEIRIRNNKSRPIKITVQDQIPVSDNKEIKIELKEKSKAKHDKDQGFLKWSHDIPEGQEQKNTFKYKLQYPKNYPIMI